MVLSVPSYYTEQERKALLDAADIAGVNVVKLMNESTAIALGYGIFRKSELDATPRNVCFVDFGHCKSSVFIASLTKEKVKILNQQHERNLGVRDIDWKLLEFYAKICVDQYDANPIKKEKSRLRLLDAIEKQRKILSANLEASINVDYIVEDNDLSYTLTREKLEELAVPIVARFKVLLESLKAGKYHYIFGFLSISIL
jgi:heat shock protein 4